MDDLERLLDEQLKWDLKNPKEAKRISRFMVVEGLYINAGDICPLAKIVSVIIYYGLMRRNMGRHFTFLHIVFVSE